VNTYCGRFAPSPTGLLHAGSMVAALASWLDARSQGGRWLVRIEDVDAVRCKSEHAHALLRQLAVCGLVPDAPPVWQSARGDGYQRAFDRLLAAGHLYACACSRQAMAAAVQGEEEHQSRRYTGLCRVHGADQVYQHQALDQSGFAWRVLVDDSLITWADRRLGVQSQSLADEVGDFIVRRRDGLWAYQLAVVVDDAEQGITHVVRGEDLADNTARQIHLQNLLGLPRPQYLHTPLVLDAHGRKLSKHHAARPIDERQAVHVLRQAAAVLGIRLTSATASVAETLLQAVQAWGEQPRCDGCP
jgi:glutamyl-Q tRNA(Asp) synthetase